MKQNYHRNEHNGGIEQKFELTSRTFFQPVNYGKYELKATGSANPYGKDFITYPNCLSVLGLSRNKLL